jgi:hypothetical protein
LNGIEAQPPALQRLEPFVGEWTTEATFPAGGPSGLTGRTTFEWALHGRFLLQRSEVPHPDAPDGLCVIAAVGDAFTQHYFDQRGVVRTYSMTFTDGIWTLLRDSPDFSPLSFWQRFTGTFSADATRIDGRWEKSQDEGATWEHDFHLAFERAAR